jgi:hypothetical protein
MAWNSSVSIGLSSRGFEALIVVQATAVSFTTRRSSARNSAGSWPGSSRMSSSAVASAGMVLVLFEP